MKSDVEIAQATKGLDIERVASKLGIEANALELYGRNKAKISTDFLKQVRERKGQLVLVTAMTPTKAGEGKSTTTIGLTDGLAALNKKVVACLREPSLGPVFGVKGGATGGGYAQVIPMEEINLHFTGDIHAVSAANNLVAALIDNHLYHGNVLGIDPNRILWKRALDMNDRALRNIQVSLKDKKAVVREDHFTIAVASPIMAILCLSKDLIDLKERLSETVFAYSLDHKALTLKDLNCVGSVATLLKDAMKPNLVQTLEGNPVLIHGGPFANIAHGSNSIIATRLALGLADIVVTEAGFGSDLGAQKFMDITSLAGEFSASAVVLVATIRALKMHGNVPYEQLKEENCDALSLGLENLDQHIHILSHYNIPVIVALNKFSTDTASEIDLVRAFCDRKKISFALNESWEKGSKGALELSEKVLNALSLHQKASKLFTLENTISERIETIAKEIYGASQVEYSDQAKEDLEELNKLGYGLSNVCMAKTQSSISDDPKLLGKPKDFTVKIQSLLLSSGAKFVVALAGDIMTMPGLSKDPAANHIDIDENGRISGLF